MHVFFLGMKMKRELENMLLDPQFEVFHHLLNSSFFPSMGHSEQVMKAKERLNKRSTSIMQRVGWGRHMVLREHLRLDVTHGLLNLSQAQENRLRKPALYLRY